MASELASGRTPPSARMERDDRIDAAVMLLIAQRIQRGEGVRLPATEQRDQRLLRADIRA